MVATGGTVSAAPPTVPAQGDLTRNSVKVHAVLSWRARACPRSSKIFPVPTVHVRALHHQPHSARSLDGHPTHRPFFPPRKCEPIRKAADDGQATARRLIGWALPDLQSQGIQRKKKRDEHETRLSRPAVPVNPHMDCTGERWQRPEQKCGHYRRHVAMIQPRRSILPPPAKGVCREPSAP